MPRNKPQCREYRHGKSGQFAYAHVKYDGHFLRCSKGSLGGVIVTSSRPTDLTAECRHVPTMKNLWLRAPNDTVILGELYCPGRPASYVKSAIAQAAWNELRFVAFAIESAPVAMPLEEVRDLCELWGLDFAEFVGADTPNAAARMGRMAVDQEGWVFKNGNMARWHKWKPVLTCDCVVTGTKDGDGKYLGLVGSLELSVYRDGKLVRVGNCSGMDDEMRIWMTENEESLTAGSTVVECEYQYLGSGDHLRHPRFKQLRDDKLPEQCTWEDQFE
jgi:hypothetical protein